MTECHRAVDRLFSVGQFMAAVINVPRCASEVRWQMEQHAGIVQRTLDSLVESALWRDGELLLQSVVDSAAADLSASADFWLVCCTVFILIYQYLWYQYFCVFMKSQSVDCKLFKPLNLMGGNRKITLFYY